MAVSIPLRVLRDKFVRLVCWPVHPSQDGKLPPPAGGGDNLRVGVFTEWGTSLRKSPCPFRNNLVKQTSRVPELCVTEENAASEKLILWRMAWYSRRLRRIWAGLACSGQSRRQMSDSSARRPRRSGRIRFSGLEFGLLDDGQSVNRKRDKRPIPSHAFCADSC
jgi:hypothetical protein